MMIDAIDNRIINGMGKIRLDEYLLKSHLVENIAIAQSVIRQGRVSVEGKLVTKPGTPVAMDSTRLCGQKFLV